MSHVPPVHRPLRVAFVGAGQVAELHQATLAELPEVALHGLFDPDHARATERSRSWSCRSYDDLDALLAYPDVYAVYCLTPHDMHEQVTLAALDAGKHVLVEKPVATPAGIDRMAQAAQARGLVCMPAHNYAYQPEFAELRRLVRSGELGQVRATFVTFVIRHDPEVLRSYGGTLSEVMVHHTYLMLALFGVPLHVHAGQAEPDPGQQRADQAWMTWEYGGGHSAHLFCTLAVDDYTADPWLFVCKVLGTEGSASYNWRSSILRRPRATLALGVPAYERSYLHESAAFARAVQGDRDAIVSTLDDARTAMEIIDAAIVASTHGARVALRQPDRA